MPDDPTRDDADPDMAAGELALGVLRGDERAAALRRMVAEPAFADRVDAWQARLAPLMDGIADTPAPPRTWSGVARAIDGFSGRLVARWRAAALVATALAAGLAAVLVLRPAPVPQIIVQPTRPLLAQVAGEGGATLVSAQYDAVSGKLRVRTTNLPAGERLPELWVIVGEAAPRSLGLVALDGTVDYVPSASLRQALADGVTIAVTLEPRSATPHAAPSGAILGTAKLTAV